MWCFIVASVPRDFEYIQNVTVGRFLSGHPEYACLKFAQFEA